MTNVLVIVWFQYITKEEGAVMATKTLSSVEKDILSFLKAEFI